MPFEPGLRRSLESEFSLCQPRIEVNVKLQQLTLFNENKVARFSVSTALNGVGQFSDSGCTPLGYHYIRAKIGANSPINTVFAGRRPTGEIYSAKLANNFPERDWILTRIMWLSGLEPGYNRLAKVDSMRRYIYIHGTPDSEPMGQPLSHGCIRMRNKDVMDLFSRVCVGTRVLIKE
ncbi:MULTISPECIES: L,D-transpeptidase [unclassified Oleiphilus]|jgi:lipoprotein-anchoring transpeptidase ErfK/SrfK|uniref:L,D-transpeptidase n=2 Tax=Oleiphilus TaxID=141450 RepID=UPI0009EE47E5|nr:MULTISPECIES: L,D-transpeptidase [unclassified Oleiphilus]